MTIKNATTSSSAYQFSFKPTAALLGLQNLFIAFGALVLVPILTGLDPCVALFTAGLGTLIFQVITKGQIPIFLGSSFAFIAPTIYGVQTWGVSGTLCGLASSGVVYLLLSLLVRVRGREWLLKVFPPIITGPIIMSIGLILAPVAAHMAMGQTGDGATQIHPESQALMVAFLALAATFLTRAFGKGVMSLVPILTGIVVGYVAAYFYGMVDLSVVQAAPYWQIPKFVTPTWNWEAILFIMPVALVTTIEHVGDVVAISTITGKDYLKNPGLDKTLLGDGIASTMAACLGGPPNTTYAEVTAGVAMTRAFNPANMTWAAFFAIALAFNAKIGAFLQTIPTPVMGGVLMLLFGTIAVIGLNILVEAKEDLLEPRSMMVAAIILVIPVSGIIFKVGQVDLSGIALAAIVGIILNLLLHRNKPALVVST